VRKKPKIATPSKSSWARNDNLASQRGAAIIVALFVTALVAIASVSMIERYRTDIRRSELIMNDTKARLYAEGSLAWAIEQLNNNLKRKKPNTIIDNMPLQSPVNNIKNAAIYSVIYDQEGLFNLNNLTDPEAQQGFIQLINAIEPSMKVDDVKNLIIALRDWISPSGTNNQLDDYYAKQSPAYVAPHRAMVSVSELRLVKGMTPKLYAKLLPFVTALPEQTKLNINSATPQVLMSLSPSLSLDGASAIVNHRKQHPFTTTESFLQFDIVKNNRIDDKKINITSAYFLVKTSVKIGHQEKILYTLLHRMLNNAQPIEVIIWQSKGTL
jgi:general secretion pathway protein K